jgi:hypothetical protein
MPARADGQRAPRDRDRGGVSRDAPDIVPRLARWLCSAACELFGLASACVRRSGPVRLTLVSRTTSKAPAVSCSLAGGSRARLHVVIGGRDDDDGDDRDAR